MAVRDCLLRVRHALAACAAAARRPLESLAEDATTDVRWWFRVRPDHMYERKRDALAPWKTVARTGRGQAAVEATMEFRTLADALSATAGLDVYFRGPTAGPLAGCGPVDPKQLAWALVNRALLRAPDLVGDEDIDHAVAELDEFMPPHVQRIRAIAPLHWLRCDALPIVLGSELRIDVLSIDETAEYWDATEPGAYAGERTVFAPPCAIRGEVECPLKSDVDPSGRGYSQFAELVPRALHLLRLVCDGDVAAPTLFVDARTPTGGGSETRSLGPRIDSLSTAMTLSADDARTLVTLWRASDGTLPRSVLEGLRWFGYSRERFREEDRAVDLMTAAEALFVPESSELAYRLGLRTAYYATPSDASRREVFDHMKKAYDLRSKIVHGSSKAKESELQRVSVRTQAILRVALMRAMRDGGTPDWDNLLLGS